MLVARADVAVRMGLPIYAVVALARSYADGIHRSIPAPGPGVMAVAAERRAREGEATGAELCDLARRCAEWESLRARLDAIGDALGPETRSTL